MKKVTAALTVLLALTLTGCAGEGTDAAGERTASPEATVETVETPEPEETLAAEPAPIQSSPEPTVEAPAMTPEEIFVAEAQNYLNGWGYWDFTNEQVLGAGLYACESAEPNPVIIEGVDSPINQDVVNQARALLCP